MKASCWKIRANGNYIDNQRYWFFPKLYFIFSRFKIERYDTDKELFYLNKKKIQEDDSILKSLENYSNNYRAIKEFDENFDEFFFNY